MDFGTGLRKRVFTRVVQQFHRPTGPAGHVAGWVMGHRKSNVRRIRWAVDLLDVRSTDRVVEFGCGPGVGIEALAHRARDGLVVGVDHSEVMIRQARRRNSGAIGTGRIFLLCAPVEQSSLESNLRTNLANAPFDAALAVNTVGFWREPARRLREIGDLLRPGGRIALVSQPRNPGADRATSRAAAEELTALAGEAGFENLRVEMLPLNPPAACVLGTKSERV